MYVLLKRADLLFGGFLLAFASSPGQTWFIALSGPALGDELNLSHGAFGTLYALATLGSGLTLMWLGGKIDALAPPWMAVGIAIGLGLSCLAMASVSSPLALLLVFFSLRFCGQGLMSQLAMTVMARSFPDARGRALAFAGLGYPAAEGLFPALLVLALDSLGWRMTWGVAGGVALLALPPALAWLLRRARTVAHGTAGSSQLTSPLRRREILFSVRFILLLPALITTGFVITAVFFHQGALSQAKGWPPGWFAVCIPGYAVASVIATLAAGFLVDRRRADRILPLFLVPLSAGLALLATTATPSLAFVAIAFAGLTAGASNTIITAALTELYGVANIATVRALCASAMIIASALSPALVGIALDTGFTMDAVLFACLGLSLAAGPLAARGIARGAAPLLQRGMS